jgi:hypothetical protein
MTKNCTDIQDKLSEFADGSVVAADRAEIEAHLDGCVACRDVLNDLQELRRAAARLGPIDPPDHVWLQVAGQTRTGRGPVAVAEARVAHRAGFSQWFGLAAALVAITIGAQYFVRSVPQESGSVVTTGNAPDGASVQRITDELSEAMTHFENAITQLEGLANASSGVLDAQMKETMKQNILTVNAAIAESRAALEQNPGNATAQVSLYEALRRKVVVLQATVNLMNEMRKGNQTGTVEAAAVFTKQS